MKTRESGMLLILDRLSLVGIAGDIVEFGCGFTIPAAERASGIVYALDIEPEMIAAVAAKAKQLPNVRPVVRDFVTEGTGLPADCADYAILFNILHAEESPTMLAEAIRILLPGGLMGIIHWNYDPTTPRGPSMEIRPRPEDIRDSAIRAGFQLMPPGVIDMPPFHYGMALRKP
jgi:SAM-dependent methyltransferase